MEVLYKYYRNDEYYYAQGIHEPYVRQALATKLGVDVNELSVGVSDIPKREIVQVCTYGLNYAGLDKSLGYSHSAKRSINHIRSKTNHNPDFIRSKVSHFLNIPRAIVDNLKDDELISSITKHSNTKIKVKTHKVCNVESDDIHAPKRKIISRVDEINNHINMLLSRDYNIFFEIDDLEYELFRSKSSYDNLHEKLSTTNKSNPKYNSMLERSSVLKEQIDTYSELIKKKYNKIYSTGYYVSNEYLHDNYEEVQKGFNEIYEKLNLRIQRSFLQDIIPVNEEFTLKEKLDSYMLFESY